MILLLATLAMAEGPTEARWELGAGFATAGMAGGRVDVARELGPVQLRVGVLVAPVRVEALGFEAALVHIASASGGEVQLRTEVQQRALDILVDWDLGARRLPEGWSGGMRLMGGVAVQSLYGVDATWSGDAVVWTASGRRIAARPVIGGALDVWWEGTWGLRFDLIGGRGSQVEALAIDPGVWTGAPSGLSCIAPAFVNDDPGCSTLIQTSLMVTHAR
jgi:hypothetical protein